MNSRNDRCAGAGASSRLFPVKGQSTVELAVAVRTPLTASMTPDAA